ncbi:MAG: signal peptidase I [Dehalococcoidia bacterium]|nr:signal peptidase I [Dehalococcoidia bacterium]
MNFEEAQSSPPPSQTPTPTRSAVDVRSALREIIETILLTLLIFLVVRALVQNFKVEGSSMEPNMHHGQFILANKAVYFNIDTAAINRVAPFLNLGEGRVFYLFRPPERGDVIVFRFPRDTSRDFIKRVIGLPGETIEIRNGWVFINGQRLNEPYIQDRPNYNYGPERVPEDNFFVLGDNRNNSSDSHVWGNVPRDFIIGKAWISYWPISQWGFAPNYRLVPGG